MKCTYCGSVIQQDDRNCPACGAPIPLSDSIPAPSPYYTVTVVMDPAPETAASTPTLEPGPAVPTRTVSAPEIGKLFQDRSNWAIASMVLGLIGVFSVIIPGVCGFITSVPAIILGAMSLKSSKRKYAITGIILGVLTIVIGVIISIVFLVATMSAGDWIQFQ